MTTLQIRIIGAAARLAKGRKIEMFIDVLNRRLKPGGNRGN